MGRVSPSKEGTGECNGTWIKLEFPLEECQLNPTLTFWTQWNVFRTKSTLAWRSARDLKHVSVKLTDVENWHEAGLWLNPPQTQAKNNNTVLGLQWVFPDYTNGLANPEMGISDPSWVARPNECAFSFFFSFFFGVVPKKKPFRLDQMQLCSDTNAQQRALFWGASHLKPRTHNGALNQWHHKWSI